MYRDPALIRNNVVKLRLSGPEDRLMEALADLTGEQKAVLLRNMVVDRAREKLGAQFVAAVLGAEVPYGCRVSG